MHNTNILPICPGRVVPVTLTHQISHGEESSESKQLYELYEQCKSLTCSELIRRINLKMKKLVQVNKEIGDVFLDTSIENLL